MCEVCACFEDPFPRAPLGAPRSSLSRVCRGYCSRTSPRSIGRLAPRESTRNRPRYIAADIPSRGQESSRISGITDTCATTKLATPTGQVPRECVELHVELRISIAPVAPFSRIHFRFSLSLSLSLSVYLFLFFFLSLSLSFSFLSSSF